MGNSRWSTNDWAAYSSTTRSLASTKEIFASSSIKDYLDPNGVLLRESRDSDSNPNSTAIIVGLDVTGSMGVIAQKMAQEGLGTLVEGILDRKPVTDPHIMIMAIGDAYQDRAPLQVSQFEADIRIGEQLRDLYLEGGGGGNSFESYDLPWYFAANRTSIDCFEKRQKKGYLITIGDELPPPGVEQRQIRSIFGTDEQRGYTASELLTAVSEKYHVFHVIVEQGSYAKRELPNVTKKWRDLLGKRAVLLSDYNYIAETILSVVEVSEGAAPETVLASWENADIRKTVHHALFD